LNGREISKSDVDKIVAAARLVRDARKGVTTYYRIHEALQNAGYIPSGHDEKHVQQSDRHYWKV